ncbi:MAG: hypothetical protein WCI77_01960 [Candidatus Omnitrophota bacterium]
MRVIKNLIVIIGMVLVGVVSIRLLIPYHSGKLAAYADHVLSQKKILTYGYPLPWRQEYRRLLFKDYDVELTPIAWCVVTHWTSEYAKGYNGIAEGYINAEFKKNVSRECAEKAEKIWKKEARH